MDETCCVKHVFACNVSETATIKQPFIELLTSIIIVSMFRQDL